MSFLQVDTCERGEMLGTENMGIPYHIYKIAGLAGGELFENFLYLVR